MITYILAAVITWRAGHTSHRPKDLVRHLLRFLCTLHPAAALHPSQADTRLSQLPGGPRQRVVQSGFVSMQAPRHLRMWPGAARAILRDAHRKHKASNKRNRSAGALAGWSAVHPNHSAIQRRIDAALAHQCAPPPPAHQSATAAALSN